jgi:hypothetical protein
MILLLLKEIILARAPRSEGEILDRPQQWTSAHRRAASARICCARAASGHATAAPPSAASNSRRPMVTAMRPSRARVRKWNDTTPRCAVPNSAATGAGGSARRLDVSSLPPFGWTYPLGGSGSFFFGRPLAGAVSAARRDRRLSPEVLKSIRRKFGVTHRVLDVLVPQPSL